MLFVMFFLAGDIFHHRRDIRFADAENSVACLPSKIWAPFFANPTRGICFYDAGKFGRSLCRARTHEHVDVIGGAADDQRGPVHLSNNATEIGEQFRSKFRFDQRVAFASAEDKMEKDVAARMRHLSSAPPGLALCRRGPAHGLRRGLHSFAASRLFSSTILGHSRLGPISFSKLPRGL